MHRYYLAAAISLLLGLAFVVGIAHGQVYPGQGGGRLNLSLSSTHLNVPVVSCVANGCSESSPPSIEACAYGGTAPYYFIVFQNGLQVAGASVPGCFNYVVAPQSAGNYSLLFKVTDSSNTPKTATTSATVTAAQLTNGSLTAYASLSKANVNVGNTVPITITPSGGRGTYKITVYVNGVLMQSVSTLSPYTYYFTANAAKVYVLQFTVADSSGQSYGLSTTLYAVPNINNNIGVSAPSALDISVTPQYSSVPPGTPVKVSAYAYGGTPPYSMSIYDQNGTALASAVAGFISYTYVGYSQSRQYSLTIKAVDSRGNQAGRGAYIQTTGIAQGYNTTIEYVSPANQQVSLGQPIDFQVKPVGGPPPYYLRVYYPNGTTIHSEYISQDGQIANFTTVQKSPGYYTLYFYLTNAAGASTFKAANVTVTGYAVPPSQQSASTITTQVNRGVSLSVLPTQYPCPCAIDVYADGGYQQSGSLPNNAQPYAFTYTPTSSGSHSIDFIVSYAGGASETITYTVNANLLGQSSQSGGQLSLAVSPISAQATPGQIAQFSVTPSGGSPPYTLIVRNAQGTMLNTESIQSSGTPFIYSVSGSSPGNYFYSFQIIDANSGTATRSGLLTVN